MDRKKLTKLTACALVLLLVGCTPTDKSLIHYRSNSPNDHIMQFTILATVIAITDGDTLVAINSTKRTANKQFKVHLAEIDAPERKQPYGQKSRQSLSEICADKRVRITTTSLNKDKYGRIMLARVSCDGVDANAEQVKRGMAWVDDKYAKDNKDKSHYLYKLQDEAKAAKRGLWADKKPIAPWEWRRGRK